MFLKSERKLLERSRAMAVTKRSMELTLWDRLSRLNFEQACRLLGPNSKMLIMQGAGTHRINIEEQVRLTDARL
jgi:hypothetical protein